MQKVEVACDTCNSDLTNTDGMPKYRLRLSSEALPHTGGAYTVLVSPPIDEDMHFCGLKCLGLFVKQLSA